MIFAMKEIGQFDDFEISSIVLGTSGDVVKLGGART